MIIYFFFNDTATTEIYTLSLHDALPIYDATPFNQILKQNAKREMRLRLNGVASSVQQECRDRKSGSAGMPRPISYAVFCLKKKNSSDTAVLEQQMALTT